MNFLRDQVNTFTGKTRFLVSRIFLHISGEDAAPLLGILNEEARAAVDQEGDLLKMGEGLVRICQYLLQLIHLLNLFRYLSMIFLSLLESGLVLKLFFYQFPFCNNFCIEFMAKI